MDNGIQIDKLSFGYYDKRVLENICAEIMPGSFVSIIGPNGSGKSTFLKAISAVIKPHSGIVLLDDKNIYKMSGKELAKKLSVVPQNTSFQFDFKVRDVVLMGRYPYVNKFKGETERDYEIAYEAMKMTNVSYLSDRCFNELSGGERQRVILAMALAQEPAVLLLDEPISNLDILHQVEMLDLVKVMSMEKKLTVIAVLHDINMASSYSNQIIMMRDGSVWFAGKPTEILNADNIKQVFGLDVTVSHSPVDGRPYIYTNSKTAVRQNGIRLHIICGGGSGYNIIHRLIDEGYKLSCGVLNEGDLDWKAAKEFSLDLAEDIPFVDITDDAYNKNLELAYASDAIILADTYFGKANIRNIELLLDERLKYKKIFIVCEETFNERDYSEGKATAIYNKLKAEKDLIMVNEENLIHKLLKVVNENE